MRTKKRSGVARYPANQNWGNKVKKDQFKSPVSRITSKKLRGNPRIKNQLCGKRRLDRYRLRGNRIISLQHLGEIVKTTSEHTRSCAGLLVLVDEERDGFGSKINFFCKKCLSSYQFLLSLKVPG